MGPDTTLCVLCSLKIISAFLRLMKEIPCCPCGRQGILTFNLWKYGRMLIRIPGVELSSGYQPSDGRSFDLQTASVLNNSL